MHFLLDCPLYIQERIKLLNVIKPLVPHYEDLTQQTEFIKIMTLEQTEATRTLAKYVFHSLEKRMKYEN